MLVHLDQLNGLPALHFDGNDSLQFANRLTDIRTVFWVIREDPNAGNGARFLLGENSTGGTYDFFGGYNHQIWNGNTSANIRNGQTWVNGQPVDGTVTNRPTAMSVVSVVTTDVVHAANFSQDRGMASGYWQGDLAELIVFNVPLSSKITNNPEDDAKWLAIETYLKRKYGIQ